MFAVLFLLAFAVELGIALFVRDRFIRPYVGDMLVVVLMYCFCRIFLSARARWLPVALFLLASLVEVLQYFDFVARLSLQNNPVLRVALGQTFDPADILCYLAGCLLLLGCRRIAEQRIY